MSPHPWPDRREQCSTCYRQDPLVLREVIPSCQALCFAKKSEILVIFARGDHSTGIRRQDLGKSICAVYTVWIVTEWIEAENSIPNNRRRISSFKEEMTRIIRGAVADVETRVNWRQTISVDPCCTCVKNATPFYCGNSKTFFVTRI